MRSPAARSGLVAAAPGIVRTGAGIDHVVAVLLALALTVPVALTMRWTSMQVNFATALLLLSVVATHPPRLGAQTFRPPATHRIGGVAILAGLFLVAWEWQHGGLWLNSQLLLYLATALSFPVCRRWFRQAQQSGLRWIYVLKLGAVLGASLLILVAVLQVPDDRDAMLAYLGRPTIYRNIRHFNYDQVLVVTLTILYAACLDRRWARFACLGILAFMSFLLAWSGGRAAILTIVAFLVLTLLFRIMPMRYFLTCILALVAGALLAVATGYADLLFGQLQRTAQAGDMATSGRLSVWADSIGVWLGSWDTVLFGLGPDAMRLHVRALIGFPPIIQAHNSVVQVLLEFGLIGFGFFVALLAVIGRRVVRVLLDRSAPVEARAVAAILTAMFGYTLLDGILYHAIPLVFVMLLTAYLFSFDALPLPGAASATRTDSSTAPDQKTRS